jgi:hypothetical protein
VAEKDLYQSFLKAKENKSFVLTSGTGSGKSLTYIVPVSYQLPEHRMGNIAQTVYATSAPGVFVAGDAATKRGIDLAQTQGFNIKVVVLPEGNDPADIISREPGDFKKLVEKSLSILDFYFQSAFSKFDKDTPEGKREISKVLLPPIKRVPNKIERAFWVQKLAKEISAREKDVKRSLKKQNWRLRILNRPLRNRRHPRLLRNQGKTCLKKECLPCFSNRPDFCPVLNQNIFLSQRAS